VRKRERARAQKGGGLEDLRQVNIFNLVQSNVDLVKCQGVRIRIHESSKIYLDSTHLIIDMVEYQTHSL